MVQKWSMMALFFWGHPLFTAKPRLKQARCFYCEFRSTVAAIHSHLENPAALKQKACKWCAPTPSATSFFEAHWVRLLRPLRDTRVIFGGKQTVHFASKYQQLQQGVLALLPEQWDHSVCEQQESYWTEVHHAGVLTSPREQAVSVPTTACPTLWTQACAHIQMKWHTFINTHVKLDCQQMLQEPRHRPWRGTLNGGWDLSIQEVTNTPNHSVCCVKHTAISSYYKNNN